jgi:hypothetical protein
MKTISLLLLLALAVPSAASASAPGLAPLASSIAGRAIVVSCSVPDDAPEAGWTIVGSSEVSISPTACRALSRLVRGDARWLARSTDSVANVYLAGAAVQALVHEATHLRLASGDEALVECAATRSYDSTLRLLPIPARLRAAVVRAALRTHANLSNPLYKESC